MTRFITTIILAFAVLRGIYSLSADGFKIFVLIAGILGLWEYARLAFSPTPTGGLQPPTGGLQAPAGGLQAPAGGWERRYTEIAGAVLLYLFLWHSNTSWPLLALAFFLFGGALLVMKRSDPISQAMDRLGLMTLGWIYLPLMLSFWGKLRDLQQGWVMVLLCLVSACLTDTFGFLFGKTVGKRLFAPILSPKKTWEGFFGAFIGSFLGALIVCALWLPQWSYYHFVAIGLLMGFVAPMGDLAESLLKRSRGVKDSSQMIPGHGGILDRLDALIFAAPVVYGYLIWVVGVS